MKMLHICVKNRCIKKYGLVTYFAVFVFVFIIYYIILKIYDEFDKTKEINTHENIDKSEFDNKIMKDTHRLMGHVVSEEFVEKFKIIGELSPDNLNQMKWNQTRTRDDNSSKEVYMTIYPPKGKLGNQMFQVATLLGIAETNNFIPFVPFSGFNINSVFILPPHLYKNTHNVFRKFNEGTVFRYEPMLNKLDNSSNWILDGYFQVYKYFTNTEDTIRKYFRFKSIYIKTAAEYMNSQVPDEHVKIGIHVRHGDFINTHQQKLGRTFPPLDYITAAMRYYATQHPAITFIVVSDDIRWSITNIQATGNQQIIFSPYKDPGYDMALMSLCDHMIITVGTFGWWGGWLAGGSVVYYSGYPRLGSQIDKQLVKIDYYPSDWIGME